MPDDDAVYSFVTVYDKNKEALTGEYRAKAFKCLARYPETHTAIPKNVFSKLSNIYPNEPDSSKHTAMSVISQLIHTDVMREKLFAFVKANYANEDADTKENIMNDICSVYYGGFLQLPIIEFFRSNFETEPENIRSEIITRLLLTVRTPTVQDSVIGFIKDFYGIFTEKEKDKFYATFFEMLPDGDELSRKLADVVDEVIEDDRKNEVEENILRAIENGEKKHDHKVCESLITKCGFVESLIAKKTFGDWSNRKIVEIFGEAICKKNVCDALETVDEVWRSCPCMSDGTSEKLFGIIKDKFKCGTRVYLFDLTSGIDKLDNTIKDVPSSKAFIEKLIEEILKPSVSSLIPGCFDAKRCENGIYKIEEFAETHPYIKDSKEYLNVENYFKALEHIKQSDFPNAVISLAKIEGKTVRTGAAEQLKKDLSGLEKNDEQIFISYIAENYLRTDEIKFSEGAETLRDSMLRKTRQSDTNEKLEVTTQRVEDEVISYLIRFGEELYTAEIPEMLKNVTFDTISGFSKYIGNYMRKYEKKAKKFIEQKLSEICKDEKYIAYMKKKTEIKQQSGGFFSKLFKKK